VPELVEVEMYRRAAEQMLHRTVSAVEAHDSWFLKEATSAEALIACLIGAHFGSARRIGKLLLLDVEGTDHVLGLRFGMTGRLVVDGGAVIDELLYSSHRNDPKFVRFAVHFADGGRAEISDPRRLGGVALDPSTTDLGPDAASVTVAQLSLSLVKTHTPLKARLLDQSRIAGIGNLIVDEVLWRAKLLPGREASSLTGSEVKRLHRVLIATIADLQQRGGSHLGDLMSSRHRDARCPRCGDLLARTQVGGRTTFFCTSEQK
jgi:formamidopyrimidine-DNA glycosylase